MPSPPSGSAGPMQSRETVPTGSKKDTRFARRAVSPGQLTDTRRLSSTSGHLAAASALTAALPTAGARARDKFVPLPDASRQSQVVMEEEEEDVAAESQEPSSEPTVAQKRGRITVIVVAESFNRKALEAALQHVAAGGPAAAVLNTTPLPAAAGPSSATAGAAGAGAGTGPGTGAAGVARAAASGAAVDVEGGGGIGGVTARTVNGGAAVASPAPAAASSVTASARASSAPAAAAAPGAGASPPLPLLAGAGGSASAASISSSSGGGGATAVTLAVTAYPEVTYVRTAHGEAMDAPGEVFFFDYGVVAFWGMTEAQEQALLAAVVKGHPGVAVQLLDDDEKQVEELLFVYSRDSPPNIRNDTFTIDMRLAANHQVKMAISHALAQSSKLGVYEERMVALVEEVRHIPREMAERGSISMSRRNVAQVMGKVFLLKAAVNLTATMLGTPEFFWRAPDQLQGMYERACEYLDIETRLDTINTRFLVLQRMLAIWSDHSAHHNLARLDVFIVLLIFIEVVLAGMEVVGFLLRRRGWHWEGPRLGQLLLGALSPAGWAPHLGQAASMHGVEL